MLAVVQESYQFLLQEREQNMYMQLKTLKLRFLQSKLSQKMDCLIKSQFSKAKWKRLSCL